jgi:hypothetical protein
MSAQLLMAVLALGGRRRLTDDELATYRRDGVVLVPGLLSPGDLARANSAATPELAGGLRAGSLYSWLSMSCTQRGLRRVALDSAAPAITAQCMDLSRSQPVRAKWRRPPMPASSSATSAKHPRFPLTAASSGFPVSPAPNFASCF